MRKTRVLLITQWFDPEPTFKGLLFAKALRDRGFDVEVLTGFPNYPGGKVYPGYKIRPLRRETVDGIRVARVALYPSHNRSALGRVANYLSFAASASLYGIFGAARPDVIYAYHPPATTGIAARLIGLFRRSATVLDIQDLWPDTLRATGMVGNRRLLAFVGAICRAIYASTDRITVLSPGFKRLLEERGVPGDKLEVIYNWADESAMVDTAGEVSPHFPREGFRVLFAGNMGAAQQLDVAIGAAEILARRGREAKFVFLGGGIDVDRLAGLSRSKGLSNVTFLPAVPMKSVGAYLAHADALLVHLREDPLFEITIPSKTQAYMAAGKPVLMGVSGDAARLVDLSGGGVSFRPGNPEAMADAVERLMALSPEELGRMGQRGRDFYLRELSLATGVERFGRVFDSLAARARGSGPGDRTRAGEGR